MKYSWSSSSCPSASHPAPWNLSFWSSYWSKKFCLSTVVVVCDVTFELTPFMDEDHVQRLEGLAPDSFQG